MHDRSWNEIEFPFGAYEREAFLNVNGAIEFWVNVPLGVSRRLARKEKVYTYGKETKNEN